MIEKVIDEILSECHKKRCIKYYGRFKVTMDRKSGGFIVTIFDKENMDPVMGMSIIKVNGGRIEFITNEEIVREFIKEYEKFNRK